MDARGGALLAHLAAMLRALAQVGFLNKPLQGALLLAGLAVISPWSAAGALLGAALAVLLGRVVFAQSEIEWAAGLGAYDAALLGLFWAAPLSRGGAPAWLFALALIACLGLRRPLRRLALVLGLPPLAPAALLVTWISIGVFAAFGANFWEFARPPSPSAEELALGAALIVVAMLLKNLRATLAALLAAAAAALAAAALGRDPLSLDTAGLWAFTVAPALFGGVATLLPHSRLGWQVGLVAALIAAALWAVWPLATLMQGLAPLMAPFFLGLWFSVVVVLGRERALYLDPELHQAARLIIAARGAGGTLALTGAGMSTASGIADYTAGAWLDPGVPLASYGYNAFIGDAGSRSLYWDACARFRDASDRAQPNPAHHALAGLRAAGWVRAVVTQNVDGLDRRAGVADLVELHGHIDAVHCLLCGQPAPWPEAGAWWRQVALCGGCGGLLKPAVIAFGEGLPPDAWRRADSAATACAAVLVVGTQLAVSSAANLVARARAHGAHCIFVSTGVIALPVYAGDRVLALPAERALPALARYLGVATAGTR